MSALSAPGSHRYPDPKFKREGPFRFFDLPTELRQQILSLLLVRGNVAIGNARNRFSDWDHEKPMWQLLEVNSQLRAEAGAVLYSQRNNTFYFPLEEAFTPIIVPPIRRLDCAFDMRACEDTAFNVFERAKEDYDIDLDPGETSFDQLSSTQRMYLVHQEYHYTLWSVWDDIASAIRQMRLELLRLDITKARCPLGCCRLAEEAVKLLDRSGYPPERIEILGALDHERGGLRTLIEKRNPDLKGRCFFVEKPGCTCAVSPCER